MNSVPDFEQVLLLQRLLQKVIKTFFHQEKEKKENVYLPFEI